jgi:hypothetical protein
MKATDGDETWRTCLVVGFSGTEEGRGGGVEERAVPFYSSRRSPCRLRCGGAHGFLLLLLCNADGYQLRGLWIWKENPGEAKGWKRPPAPEQRLINGTRRRNSPPILMPRQEQQAVTAAEE